MRLFLNAIISITIIGMFSWFLTACGGPSTQDPTSFKNKVRTLPADSSGTQTPNSVTITIPEGSLKVEGFSVTHDVPDTAFDKIITAKSKATFTGQGLNFSFDVITEHNGDRINSWDDDFQGYSETRNAIFYYTGRCENYECSTYYLSVWVFLTNNDGSVKTGRQFGYKKVSTENDFSYVGLEMNRSVDMDSLISILEGRMK